MHLLNILKDMFRRWSVSKLVPMLNLYNNIITSEMHSDSQVQCNKKMQKMSNRS